ASVDAGVDTSAVRDPRRAHRLGADDYDVSRARGVAVARRADAGADTRWVVAASRRPSPHSRVVFGASDKRGVRLLRCQCFESVQDRCGPGRDMIVWRAMPLQFGGSPIALRKSNSLGKGQKFEPGCESPDLA